MVERQGEDGEAEEVEFELLLVLFAFGRLWDFSSSGVRILGFASERIFAGGFVTPLSIFSGISAARGVWK